MFTLKRLLLLLLLGSPAYAGQYKMIPNPTIVTNKQDYVNNIDITGAVAGDCVLYDGDHFYVSACPSGGGGSGPFILLEDSSFALLEDGGKIIQE